MRTAREMLAEWVENSKHPKSTFDEFDCMQELEQWIQEVDAELARAQEKSGVISIQTFRLFLGDAL